MKSKLILFTLIILSIKGYTQSKNTFAIQYATASNAIDIHGAIGDFGYTGKGGTDFGFGYERTLSNSFSFETDFLFANDKAILTSLNPAPQNTDIKLLTVPILAKYIFFKYLFIDGGLTADFETNSLNNTLTTSQSGLGIELGIGAEYRLGHVIISVNPYFQYHGIIRFTKSQSSFDLVDSGYKFALGYSF
jgi:hypothetical protein